MSNVQMNPQLLAMLTGVETPAVPQNGEKAKRPQPKLYLNPGYAVTVNGVQEWISLPYGIGLDTMGKRDPIKLGPNASPASRALAQKIKAGNDFLDAMVALGFRLQPGQSMMIPGVGQLQRRDDTPVEVNTVEGEENPFAWNFAGTAAA